MGFRLYDELLVELPLRYSLAQASKGQAMSAG
jgi:hypothetical protein